MISVRYECRGLTMLEICDLGTVCFLSVGGAISYQLIPGHRAATKRNHSGHKKYQRPENNSVKYS